jgi:hypothetical protein
MTPAAEARARAASHPPLFPAGLVCGAALGLAAAPALRRRSTFENGVLKALTPAINAAARSVLVGRSRSTLDAEQGRFTRSDVARILRRTWRFFDSMVDDVPAEQVLGARINVGLACATIAAYKALLAEGIDRDEARRLVADVVWAIYEKMGRAAWTLSGAFAKPLAERLLVSTRIARRFPFGPPSYLMEDVGDEAAVAFDVLRCPIAEYFAANGLPELCVDAWCNQDYALAEMWGSKLQRSGTLAGGSDRCDFRWLPAKQARTRTDASRRR